MLTCRICLRDFDTLAFKTKDVAICRSCVDELNENPEPSYPAEVEIGELLRKGMAKRDPQFTEKEFQAALPGWLNRLLAKKTNNKRMFRLVRANRRGLLRSAPQKNGAYPSNWMETAQAVRRRDKRCCQSCGELNVVLDVHHIVYLSHYGTSRKENLVTLCRSCHEEEHGRIFDWSEAEEPGNLNPIQPKSSLRTTKSSTPAAHARLNSVPEQGQKLLPVLTRVLDAAFRLGYHKFKDAAKFSLDQIREHLGNEPADALTLGHLQGAYIAMSRGKQGVDTKRAVIDVESKAVIEAHEATIADELCEKAKSDIFGGLDTEMMAWGTELAVFHLEAGVRKFSDLVVAMARDLGTTPTKLKPYLRSWYNGARDMMEDHGLSIEGMDSHETVRAELTKIGADAAVADEQKAADSDNKEAKADERNKI